MQRRAVLCMRRTVAGAPVHAPAPHVLTNSLHERELVQFIASEAGLFLGISLGLRPREIPWSSPFSLEGFRLILG